MLAGRVMVDTAAPPEVAANVAPAEDDDRLMVVGELLVIGLPKTSSSVVVKPLAADVLATALKAAEVIASLAAATVSVKFWV